MYKTSSLALFTVLLCRAALATTYNCSPIVVPDGGSAAVARGINSAGNAVGTYQSNSTQHGFIANLAGGTFQTIDYPGATGTQLFTINNNGVSVGEWTNSQNGTGGYFTRDAAGNFAPLNVPAGYIFNRAYGINDNGAISGTFSQASTNTSFGILNPDGTITAVPGFSDKGLDLPGSLNNTGQMTESYSLGIAVAALASAAGQIATLQYAQSPTFAYGVNNAGIVAGFASDAYQQTYNNFTYNVTSRTYAPTLCTGYALTSQPGFFAISDNGALAGQAIATPLQGSAQFSISPGSLTFPPTPAGQTTAPLPVTITNTGDARLDMYFAGGKGNLSAGVVIGSSNALAVFHIDTGCFSAAGVFTSLDPGASCTMMITATPNYAPAQLTDTAQFIDSAPGSPHGLALSIAGTLPPPSCTVSTTSGGASLTLQDVKNGLQSITLVDSTNATVNIPSFASGETNPVTVTASQIAVGKPSKVDVRGTNVAGGSIVCGTSFNSAGGPPTWTGLGGLFNGAIAMATNSDGRLQAFTRGTDNALWTISQTAPDGAWSTWTSIGGVLDSDPAVGVDSDGRLQVFVLGSDGSLWTIAQTSPGADLSGWQALGNTLTGAPSVATNSDGRLQVFARGSDNALWTISQASAGGTWNSWLSLGGVLRDSATPAITNTNGSMEVFVIGSDDAVWHRWQNSPSGYDWSGWNSLGRPASFRRPLSHGRPRRGGITTVRPVINKSNGLVDLVGLGTDNSLWSLSHVAGSDWGTWTSLGGIFTGAPSAIFDSNGLLEIFGRGADNALYRATAGQTDPPFNFTGWTPMGGYLTNGPTAAINQNGRVAAFVEGGGNTLWTIEQSQPGVW
jgi:hypothetical protein